MAAIKLARYMDYGPDEVVMTIATDSARLYTTEMQAAEQKFYANGVTAADADKIFTSCLEDISDEHVLELGQPDRRRIFNLGYYTWVEQQGVSVEAFDSRKDQSFWKDIAASVPAWDQLIDEFNAEVGLG